MKGREEGREEENQRKKEAEEELEEKRKEGGGVDSSKGPSLGKASINEAHMWNCAASVHWLRPLSTNHAGCLWVSYSFQYY